MGTEADLSLSTFWNPGIENASKGNVGSVENLFSRKTKPERAEFEEMS